MGKPIIHEYGQEKGILKFFPYQGAACVVPQSMQSSADANGYKIVPAGTPFPSNDANCLGYLLESVDVTQGDAPGTYVFDATIDWEKVKDLNPAISYEARKATKKVIFYGAPVISGE